MDIEKIAKAYFEDLISDRSHEEEFFDKNGVRLFPGMKVIHIDKYLATVKWCRFGYTKRHGFNRNYLPLCMIDFDDESYGLKGIETTTSSVEVVNLN